MLTVLLAALVPWIPVADQHPVDFRPVEVWDVIDGIPDPSSTPYRAVPVRPDPDGRPGPHSGSDGVGEPWLSLADCESGDWIDGGTSFVAGSARWDWAKPGTDVPPWGTRIHHGGLQFAPSTWSWVAPDVLAVPPRFAYDASPAEQVAVAVETQRRQGWGAWPVCARKLGLR